jgi:fermentation-respiration switch protein FrsA (DUF1100 family)
VGPLKRERASPPRRRRLDVLLYVLAAYLLLAGFALVFGERLMFQPPPAGYDRSAEIIQLMAADGVRIAAVWLPNPDAEFAVLYSHGNAEDLGHIMPVLRALRDLGVSVLAYDYRGYGMSEGRPSADGALLDQDAAFAHLTGTLGFPSGRIIAWGRSIGGGPATSLAAREPLAGLVLESTFTSAFRVVTRWPLLPRDRFRNLALLRTVRCPVLVIHGRRDAIVPFHHGRALFEAAAGPKRHLWVDGAGHNDVWQVAGESYARAVRDFVTLLRERQAEGGATTSP